MGYKGYVGMLLGKLLAKAKYVCVYAFPAEY